MKKTFALLIVLTLCLLCCGAAANAAGNELPVITDDMLRGVPRIDVTTANGNGASLQKADGYTDATIRITDVDGSVIDGSITIKVRGNSTALVPILKKSFTVKFSKKTEVLGMGKGKKWVLQANAFDPTLLRNYLAFDMAHELGLPYASEQRFVELWLDGSYHGCYTVYEPVQEGKDRVNIDIESNDGKKDFLLELEKTRVDDDKTYLTVGGLRFAITDPEEPNDDQYAYITGVMTNIVNTLQYGTEEQIREKIDVPSFAAYYLLNEYTKMIDFNFSSVHFFYQDGKLFAGPPWDYDLALGNSNPSINSTAAKATSNPEGIMQSKSNLYRWLCNKSWFREEIKQVYIEHYDYISGISADGGLLDTQRARYAAVFAHNFEKWSVRRHWLNYQKVPLATYGENFAFLKDWCAARNAWLTEYYELFPQDMMLLGDADGNGSVTVLDATVIQRVLAKLSVKSYVEAAADADENGSVTILDATAIQRWLAKLPTHEGIGENML